MPSFDNLAGIYFDSSSEIELHRSQSHLPLCSSLGPCNCHYGPHGHHGYHGPPSNQHDGSQWPGIRRRSSSKPVSAMPSYSNIHEGLALESFSTSPSVQRLDQMAPDPSASTSYLNSSWPTKPSLETLPAEVLTHILQYVLISSDSPAAVYPDMTRDFARLLTSCYAFYNVGVPILYRHVSFPHPRAFDKFRHSIEKTGYGNLVKVLDFSAFTSVGLGRTGKMMQEIQMVTASTILRALELCPGLKEFLVAESVDMDIDLRVLNALETMPYVDCVDFCGSTSNHENGFTNSLMQSNIVTSPNAIYHLTKVSFHGCAAIKPTVFDALLPKLVNVTRLDLTHTQVTPDALLAIPASAKITHLSVAKCVKLNSSGLTNFLTLHPATRYLEWLNIMFESTKPVPLSKRDFETVLQYLPPLQYLNLHGLPVEKKHLKYLAAMDLRSLSLGYAPLSFNDLEMFLPQLSELKYLDLTGNPSISVWTIQDKPSILDINPNIDIYEFTSEFVNKLWGISIPGFNVEYGKARRGWMYRNRDGALEPPKSSEPAVTPSRPSGFSFSALAKDRLHRSSSPQAEPVVINTNVKPPTVESQPSWGYASRKINMCDIGIGGNMTREACKERGIYSYYAYHI